MLFFKKWLSGVQFHIQRVLLLIFGFLMKLIKLFYFINFFKIGELSRRLKLKSSFDNSSHLKVLIINQDFKKADEKWILFLFFLNYSKRYIRLNNILTPFPFRMKNKLFH